VVDFLIDFIPGDPIMPFDLTTLDEPFKALAAYDWGADAAPFKTIDAAVIAAHADKTLRAELEKRFVALLGAGTSRAAREYVCRKLMMIGTAASVPALAALLGDSDNSHMARFALERIPGPEAGGALNTALATVSEPLKVGMISSLAARRDTACVMTLTTLLKGAPLLAIPAANALGSIHSAEAVQALAAADPFAGEGVGEAIVNARLACAEAFLAGGKRADALAIYQTLAKAAAGKADAKAVELAATRGILACADAVAAAS
jgi:hypothetical protein